jgi:hypothetical protein
MTDKMYNMYCNYNDADFSAVVSYETSSYLTFIVERFGLTSGTVNIHSPFIKYLCGFSEQDGFENVVARELVGKTFQWQLNVIENFIQRMHARCQCKNVNFYSIQHLFDTYYLQVCRKFFCHQDLIFYSFMLFLSKVNNSISDAWRAFASSFIAQSLYVTSINVTEFKSLFISLVVICRGSIERFDSHGNRDICKCGFQHYSHNDSAMLRVLETNPRPSDSVENTIRTIITRMQKTEILRFSESDIGEESMLNLLEGFAAINHTKNDGASTYVTPMYTTTYVFLMELIYINWDTGLFDVRGTPMSMKDTHYLHDLHQYIHNLIMNHTDGVITAILEESWNSVSLNHRPEIRVQHVKSYSSGPTSEHIDMYCHHIHEICSPYGIVEAQLESVLTRLHVVADMHGTNITTSSNEILLDVFPLSAHGSVRLIQEVWGNLDEIVTSVIVENLDYERHFFSFDTEKLIPSRLIGAKGSTIENSCAIKFIVESLENANSGLLSNRCVSSKTFNNIYAQTHHRLYSVHNVRSRALMEVASRGVKLLSGSRFFWNHARDARDKKVSYICTMCGNVGNTRYSVRVCGHADMLRMTKYKIIRTKVNVSMVLELLHNVRKMDDPDEFLSTCSTGYISPANTAIKYGIIFSGVFNRNTIKGSFDASLHYLINNTRSTMLKLREGKWENIYTNTNHVGTGTCLGLLTFNTDKNLYDTISKVKDRMYEKMIFPCSCVQESACIDINTTLAYQHFTLRSYGCKQHIHGSAIYPVAVDQDVFSFYPLLSMSYVVKNADFTNTFLIDTVSHHVCSLLFLVHESARRGLKKPIIYIPCEMDQRALFSVANVCRDITFVISWEHTIECSNVVTLNIDPPQRYIHHTSQAEKSPASNIAVNNSFSLGYVHTLSRHFSSFIGRSALVYLDLRSDVEKHANSRMSSVRELYSLIQHLQPSLTLTQFTRYCIDASDLYGGDFVCMPFNKHTTNELTLSMISDVNDINKGLFTITTTGLMRLPSTLTFDEYITAVSRMYTMVYQTNYINQGAGRNSDLAGSDCGCYSCTFMKIMLSNLAITFPYESCTTTTSGIPIQNKALEMVRSCELINVSLSTAKRTSNIKKNECMSFHERHMKKSMQPNIRISLPTLKKQKL